MCDYSLQHVKSRPARNCGPDTSIPARERLLRRRIATRQFAFFRGQNLPSSTPVRRNRLRWLTWKAETLPHTTAIFRQVNKDNPRIHHDALEFPDGHMVLLTDLLEGQEATVLQLPAQPVTAVELKAQEWVRFG
jgi:hypothetical protein